MPSFLTELTRRNVVKVCLAYLATAWLLLQVADTVLSAFESPAWVLQALIVVFSLGLPAAVVIAWVFEITPQGVMKTDDIQAAERIGWHKTRKLDFAIIAILSLALVAVVIDQYVIEPPPATSMSRLAVLPLNNRSGDPDQQYFADGMTEALITNLAGVSALRVVPRTSVMRFSGSERSLPAIAAELGADAIVSGSVERSGDRIRVLVQLIDARKNEVLWGHTVESDFDEVFLVQSQLAQAIAREANIAITPQEESRIARTGEASAVGYDEYLRGMQYFYRLTPSDLETALRHFDLALEQNPDSPLPHSGVAATWIGLQQMGFVRSSEATPRAEAAALRALELDDQLAQPHLWLAIIRAWSNWNWGEAEALFLRAIELNPSYADVRGSYGHLLAVTGRFEEAFEQIEIGLELDPFNPWIRGQYGVVYHMTGRFEEAIEMFHEALRIAPDLPFVWLVLAGSYHQTGQEQQAVDAEGSLLAALGDTEAQLSLRQTHAEHGYEAAMTSVADWWANLSEKSGTLGWWAAYRYAHTDNDEQTIKWLQRAYEQRDPTLPFLRFPEYEHLYDDPGMREIMQQTGTF